MVGRRRRKRQLGDGEADEAAAAAGDGAERKVKRSGNKRVTCRPLLAVFCVSMVVDLSGFLMLAFFQKP